ncbi:MAG: putative ABC transporter permease [Oscillospiraceae bacterium]|nr:putative ABC transporter permease [Oscillospiraceae bacterium]
MKLKTIETENFASGVLGAAKYRAMPVKYPVLFLMGGFIYGALEVIVKRGDTHISMFALGGLCFLLIGALNEKIPLLLRMFSGAIIITLLEFISGLIFNIWLGQRVWDYSHLPLNLMGQVCLWFTIAWFFLCLPGIWLGGYLKWRLFGEKKPIFIRRGGSAPQK